MRCRQVALALALGSALGCSDDDHPAAATETGGTGGDTTTSDATGGGAGTTTSATGGMPGAGGESPEVPPLPGESREYQGVVNLVSRTAPARVEEYLADDSSDLSELTQWFYESYPDEYDFIIFVLPYALDETTFASFDVVERPVIPGTGIEQAIDKPGFGTLGRLKGVIGTQGDPAGGKPPFEHELLHYWANYLDNRSFGFGVDLDNDYGAHWGHAGVFGQLGGFDPGTLACAAPSGAVPPDCTPENSGRIRYTMSAFGPNSNAFKGVDFAPLELYLMGVVPIEEVPNPILVLDAPQYVAIDLDADTATVEADGIEELNPSEIVARHGMRELTAEPDRQLTAAFVVVSQAPLDDATLGVFANWSDVLGNHRATLTGGSSFEQKTGGRMSLSTRIGRRRSADDAPPEAPM